MNHHACRLYLDEQQLTAWMRRRGRWHETAIFPNTDEGQIAFADFLACHRQQRFILLVNQAAEHRICIPLPEATAQEQQHLAASRAARLFPDTPWRCTKLTPKPSPGQACLLALSNTPALQQWTELLRKQAAALAGIFSLPQLLPALLDKLAQCHEPEFLVLCAHRQHYRLSLLSQGQVVHSRLLPSLPDPNQLAEFSAPGTPGQQGRIRPLYLVGPGIWPGAGNLLGIAQHIATDQDDCKSLFLNLPARDWPREQFAPGPLLQTARLQTYRNHLYRLSLLIGLSGAGITSERMLSSANTDQEIRLTEQRLVLVQEELQRLQSAVSDPPETRDTLRLLAQHPFPVQVQDLQASLTALGRILQQHPDFSLDTLSWENGLLTRSTAENAPKRGQIQFSGHLPASDGASSARRQWQNLQHALQGEFSVKAEGFPHAGSMPSRMPFSLHLTPELTR